MKTCLPDQAGVVFESGDEGGHWVKVDILNVPNLHLIGTNFFIFGYEQEIPIHGSD